MVYTVEDIERIVDFKTWSNRKKIDELLRIDCGMYCNLGQDSSSTEKKLTKKKSRQIYQHIKKLDKRMGDLFLTAMDKSE